MARALTDNSQAVLNAVATGKNQRDVLSRTLNMTGTTVGNSLRSLIGKGLIEVNKKDGSLSITPDGREHATVRARAKRTGTKMEQARVVFQKYNAQGRPAVLSRLRDDVGLTEKGAITYYQNLRVEAGLGPVSAAHSRAKSKHDSKIRKVGSGRSKKK